MPTILVVDDLAIFREPIEVVLRAEGYTVVTAADGAKAVTVMQSSRPDLVLLDLDMPLMDGLTVLRQMRASPATRTTPVLIISVSRDRAQVAEVVKLGISGYILKTEFSLKSLLDRISKTLNPPVAVPGASGAATAAGTRVPDSSASGPAGSIAPPAPEVDLKTLRPLTSRSELLERVNADAELTGFSPTVSQVLKLTANPHCSMEQVSKAVGQDHAVALKILRLANSVVYARGERVDTVHKAVLRIGTTSIRQAVLNIGVVERFASVAFSDRLSTPLFWEHSIACGLIAAQLANSLKHKEPDAGFTAGLLHDLGRVLYAERLGATYVQVLDAAAATGLPLEQVEQRLLLMDHAEVMDRVLNAWRFPKDLVNPIVLHHKEADEGKSLAPNQSAEVLRLGLADRLAHAMMLGSSGNDTIYPTEEHCRLLQVDASLVRLIEETARRSTDDTKYTLMSHSSTEAWPRRIEHYRAMLGEEFCPLYVSASPELDAFRIFTTELAGGTLGAGKPNLAVVHISSAREKAGVLEMLRTAEQKAKSGELPILLLVPEGGPPALGVLPERACCLTLTTPTPVARFVGAVKSLLAPATLRRAA